MHEFQNPATHILKVFKQHINNDVNYTFQAKELGFDEQVNVDPMQLLAVTTPAKSWFHKRVDQSDRLRSLFKEVSVY